MPVMFYMKKHRRTNTIVLEPKGRGWGCNPSKGKGDCTTTIPSPLAEQEEVDSVKKQRARSEDSPGKKNPLLLYQFKVLFLCISVYIPQIKTNSNCYVSRDLCIPSRLSKFLVNNCA